MGCCSSNTGGGANAPKAAGQQETKKATPPPRSNGAADGSGKSRGSTGEVALTVSDSIDDVDRRGRDITRDYQIQRKIGSGNYSTVHRGVNLRTQEVVAIKVASKRTLTQEDIDAVYVEVDVLQELDHPNVVKLKAFYEDAHKFYLVMELLTGGELLDSLIEKVTYSEAEARTLVETLARAIDYCHGKGVVHRDLKLENLLLSSKGPGAVVKIADFGFAKRFSSFQDLTTSCGTPGYVAPEILMHSVTWYGPQVDTWSLGVIMFILLVGYPPFTADNQNQLFRMIKRGDYSVETEDWADISPEAKDLVRRLLTVDPSKRITPKQMLNHKWLSAHVSTRDLPATRDHLAGLKARRRLRRAYLVVSATNKMKRAMGVERDRAASAASAISEGDEGAADAEDESKAGTPRM